MEKTTILLAITCLFISSFAFAVNLDDGESYTVGSEAGDDIYLGTGEDLVGGIALNRFNLSTPGTHLNLKDGGVVSDMWAYHTSTIDMSGGEVNESISARDQSQVTITGGVVNQYMSLHDMSTLSVTNAELNHLTLRNDALVNVNNASTINNIKVYDDSTLKINGGWIEMAIYAGSQNASITMNDGSARSFSIYGNSTGIINGGSVREYMEAGGESHLVVKDGLFQELTSRNNGEAYIEGGRIEGIINVVDDAYIHIKGGEILDLLRVFENGTINLYGSDFFVNGEPIGYGKGIFEVFGDTLDLVGGHYDGRITGVLSDGTLIDNAFSIFNRGSYEGDADIYIIPEPASIALLSLGILALKRRKA